MLTRTTVVLVAFLYPCTVFATEGFGTDAVAPDGGAALLLRMLLVLGGVCMLAFVTLKWGLKRFVSPDASPNGAMRVVARLPVEPRRSIMVVRIASRTLVLGSSEAGFEALGELSAEEATALEAAAPPARSFASVFAAVRPGNVSRETIATEEP